MKILNFYMKPLAKISLVQKRYRLSHNWSTLGIVPLTISDNDENQIRLAYSFDIYIISGKIVKNKSQLNFMVVVKYAMFTATSLCSAAIALSEFADDDRTTFVLWKTINI